MRDWTLNYVEAVLSTTGWTMNQLAEEIGVSASTINRPMREGGGLSRKTVTKIREKTGIDPSAFAPEDLSLGWHPRKLAVSSFSEEPLEFKHEPPQRPMPTLTLLDGKSTIAVTISDGLAQITATVDADGIAKLREKLELIERVLRD